MRRHGDFQCPACLAWMEAVDLTEGLDENGDVEVECDECGRNLTVHAEYTVAWTAELAE